MKPTRMWTWNCKPPSDERWQMCRFKRLKGEKGSFCPVNNRKHDVLIGLEESGHAWKIEKGAVYTKPMGAALAHLVL